MRNRVCTDAVCCLTKDQCLIYKETCNKDRQKGTSIKSNLRCSQLEFIVQLQQCIAALPFVQRRFSNSLCQQRHSIHKHMLISIALAAMASDE